MTLVSCTRPTVGVPAGVDQMALAARIPTPRIDLIDDLSPNAFAIGRDPEHSVICVTQGLLDQMDREELQGVIGHEAAHIRNCDTRLTTMVTAMFGGFGVFSGRLISIMLSREREYLADASAVEFTRNRQCIRRYELAPPMISHRRLC